MKQRAKLNTISGDPLIIIKNDVSYALPVSWSISGIGNIEYKAKLEDRGYSHGSTLTGDKYIKGRSIKIGLYVKGATEEEHDKLLNEIFYRFGQEDYMLICGRTDRNYFIAKASKTSHKFIKGFKQRYSEVDFTLLLEDPFRYDRHMSEKVFAFTEAVESQTVQLNNTGNADTPLKITLEPDVAMTDVIIYHKETQKQLRVRDTFLTNPATLVITTKGGTVLRGTDNAINNMSGQFLSALPGINHYNITSAAGQIKMQYYARWMI